MECITGPWQSSEMKLYVAPELEQGADPELMDEFRTVIHVPAVLELVDHWAALRIQNGARIKELIDPVRFSKILANTFIEMWDETISQSRITLEGEGIKDLWGGSAKGMSVDEHVAGDVNLLWKTGDRLNFVDHRATFASYNLGFRDRDYHIVGDVTLPMENQNGRQFAIGCIWKLGN